MPTVTAEYINALHETQGGICALTGAVLTVQPGAPDQLYLDRVDPAGDYVEGNIQWITASAARFKGSSTEPDIYRMCKAVLVHALKKQGKTH